MADHAPVCPYTLAHRKHIEIRYAHLFWDGIVERMGGGGYKVTLKQAQPETRERFTLAHELIHTFFLDLDLDRPGISEDTVGLFQEQMEEENLCDIGAAEILMPEAVFKAKAGSRANFENLESTAQEFQVSWSATLRRLNDLGLWCAALVKWDPFVEEGEVVLRTSWSISPRGVFIPRRAKARPGWGVLEAWSSGLDSVELPLTSRLGSLVSGTVVISKTIRGSSRPAGVLSLIPIPSLQTSG